MKAIAMWVLIGMAALLLTGCPVGWTHRGWDGDGGHMRGTSSDWHPMHRQ